MSGSSDVRFALVTASARALPDFACGSAIGMSAKSWVNSQYALAAGLGMSVDLLEGSPFTGFLWPGVILAVAVGGSGLLAWIALLTHAPGAIEAGAAAGAVLVGWIAVQVAMLGYISVLQPVMAGLGLATLLVALEARRRRHLAFR